MVDLVGNISNVRNSPQTCLPPRPKIVIITDAYTGIPQNLLLNLIGFFILIILFGLLRKKAWNYGRLALLHKTDNRWMELFYGSNDNRETDLLYIEASVNTQLSQVDRGFFSWIITAFKVTDEELVKRAGTDGLLYITFERYLMVLVALMTFVSLTIALPINWIGPMQPDIATFGHTTISNLDPESGWIWVHSILTILYLPVGGYIMRGFLKKVRNTRPIEELLAARTLLITEIPKHQCNVETLQDYFKEAFPNLTVEDITIAHDTERLTAIDTERDRVQQAKLYCENYVKRREPLKIYPYPCGQVLGCCCKHKQIDALDFYSTEEVRLTALFEEEKTLVLRKPLGIAFVTLGTPGAAKSMRKQLRASQSVKWLVDWAPAPSDIFWENLGIAKPCWYLNALLINVALGVVLFFVTTPAVIVQTVNKLPVFGEIKNLSPVLSSFLPTLLLVTVAAVMPALVGRSESLVRHWTRSSLNRATMRKTLLLLLLMVLILPSLGLTSAQAVLDWTVTVGNNTERWECIFLPDQGALFVNYIITAALVGCGLELMRFSELALYVFRLCTARSRAERIHVRKAVVWEFPLGAHYAWLLLVFTMTTFYSLACPLITPFGLLYLIIKYFVDRHNLCFAYGPAVGGGQLAGAAAKSAGAAPILAQIALLMLGLVRRRRLSPLVAVQLSGLAASVLGMVTGATLPVSKPKHQTAKRDLAPGQSFIAPVLRRRVCVPPEETLSETTASQPNSPGMRVSTTSTSLQDSPRLYQDYNRDSPQIV